jgi:hypothetical protein
MTREVAERLNQLFLECAARLDEMTALIRQQYPPEEVSVALQDMALTNGHLMMVMKAVYEQHRELMPPQLRSEQ